MATVWKNLPGERINGELVEPPEFGRSQDALGCATIGDCSFCGTKETATAWSQTNIGRISVCRGCAVTQLAELAAEAFIGDANFDNPSVAYSAAVNQVEFCAAYWRFTAAALERVAAVAERVRGKDGRKTPPGR